MLQLEPARTALLVMDMQTDILGMLGESSATLLQHTTGLLAAARKAGVIVIYITVGFRRGYPEMSPRNQTFAMLSQSGGRFVSGTPGNEVSAAVAPQEVTSSSRSTA